MSEKAREESQTSFDSSIGHLEEVVVSYKEIWSCFRQFVLLSPSSKSLHDKQHEISRCVLDRPCFAYQLKKTSKLLMTPYCLPKEDGP